ncbi:MAG TPA: Uma2 family endonuclease [Bryobacteraceae bacterium]|nr:Uma2 family endonuclease [Bryobacteraceae bacterium]
MATTTTRPMTFEEFAQLPEPQGFRYELHHGELVQVSGPKLTHMRVQYRLLQMLMPAAGDRGIVTLELGFRAVPESEYRRADVAYVTRQRWDAPSGEDYFRGAPELVVEVLSPSNTASEIRDKRNLCLANGSVEFWVVDPQKREVDVHTRDGRFTTYGAGQQIPLFFAPGASFPVDAIFA